MADLYNYSLAPSHNNELPVAPSTRRKGKARKNSSILPAKHEFLDSLEPDPCPVCYCEITKPVRIACGHNFCAPCARKWFQDKNTCPTCRRELYRTDLGSQYDDERDDLDPTFQDGVPRGSISAAYRRDGRQAVVGQAPGGRGVRTATRSRSIVDEQAMWSGSGPGSNYFTPFWESLGIDDLTASGTAHGPDQQLLEDSPFAMAYPLASHRYSRGFPMRPLWYSSPPRTYQSSFAPPPLGPSRVHSSGPFSNSSRGTQSRRTSSRPGVSNSYTNIPRGTQVRDRWRGPSLQMSLPDPPVGRHRPQSVITNVADELDGARTQNTEEDITDTTLEGSSLPRVDDPVIVRSAPGMTAPYTVSPDRWIDCYGGSWGMYGPWPMCLNPPPSWR